MENSEREGEINLSRPESVWKDLGDDKTSTPMRKTKSRRSWFEKTPGTKYEIAVENNVKGRSAGKRKSDVELETLLLTHFTNPPRIGFGKTKPGLVKTRSLLVKNPHEYEQKVKVERFPYKKDFTIDATEFVVDAESSLVVTLTWRPENEGNFREMILFLIDGAYRLQAFVFGTSEAPPKKKKFRGKGILGTRVKNPFTVVQTPSLANIAKSYSPQKGQKKRKSLGKVSKDVCDKKTNDMGFTPAVEIPVEVEVKFNKKTDKRKSGHRRSSTYRVQHLDVSPIKVVDVSTQQTVATETVENKENIEVTENVSLHIAKQEQEQEICKTDFDSVPDPVKVENITPKKCADLSAIAPRQYVSPNSFLHDSICIQQETCDVTGIPSVTQQPIHSTILPTPEKCLNDQEMKKYVSPNSFLRDLNITQEAVENKSTSSIPSPSAILNDSVPHDIVVRQLKYIKTNLTDANSRQKTSAGDSKLFEFSAKGKAPVGGPKLEHQGKDGKLKKVEIRRETFVRKMEPRRDTFVKRTAGKNPFSVVPEGTSPRRTTFLVKESSQKLQNKRQQFVKGRVKCNASKQTSSGISLPQSQGNNNAKACPITKVGNVAAAGFTKIKAKKTLRAEAVNGSKDVDHTEKVKETNNTEICHFDALPTPERLILGNSHTVKKKKFESDVIDSDLNLPVKLQQRNMQSDSVLPTPERHLGLKSETRQIVNDIEMDLEPDSDLSFKSVQLNILSDSVLPTPERHLNHETKTPWQKGDTFDKSSEDSPENLSVIEVRANLDEVLRKNSVNSQTVTKETNCKVPQPDLVLPTPERHLTSNDHVQEKNENDVRLHHTDADDKNKKYGGSLTVSKETAGVTQQRKAASEGDLVLPTPERILQSPSTHHILSYARPNDNRISSGKQLFSPGNLSSSFGSPKRLPDSPLLRDITHCATMTTTKSRPSDALMEATAKSTAACLFQVDTEEAETALQKMTGSHGNHCNSIEQEEDEEIPFLISKCSGTEHHTRTDCTPEHVSTAVCQQPSSGPNPDKSDSFSVTPKQLPTSPNPDKSRRSTHVVENPKVLNVSVMGRKKLFPPLEDDGDDQCSSKQRNKMNAELGNVKNGNDKHGLEECQIKEAEEERKDSELQPKGTNDVNADDKLRGDSDAEINHTSDTDYEGKNITKGIDAEEKNTDDIDAENKHIDDNDDENKHLEDSDAEDKENKEPERCPSTRPSCKEESEERKQCRSGYVEFISFPQGPSFSENTKTTKTTTNSIKRVGLQSKENERKRQKTETVNQVKKVVTRQQKNNVAKQPQIDTDTHSRQKSGVNSAKMDKRTATVTKGKTSDSSRPLMKGVAKNKLILMKKTKTVIPKHPMPFASKNMYYDERWMEKQERGFVHWLNFVLTPEDFQQTNTKAKVDAGKLFVDSGKNGNVKLAPTKEVLSFREYGARRRLNQLRKASCRLFQSAAVVKVIQKLEAEIESCRLVVRKDRMVHADLGLKQSILDILLSFNSLWLRVGLETCFGEMIPVQSNSDVIGLSRFIVTRLLANPEIAQEYAHPTVPHLYRDGYATAIARHLLKKFLMVVFFLDYAKRQRLIHHDPCLFCRDAEFKTCKAILIEFSRNYLAGEGDVTRHLGYLGYTVGHIQTAMDEFDYAVSNLATDLRDGLRLNRVVDLLSNKVGETRKLRAPAISRLQKIHNMEIFFQALTAQGIVFEKDGLEVKPRDIVDGHKEKTLYLLWNLIIQYQVQVLINEEQLREEINVLQKSLKVKNQLDALHRYEQGLQQRRRESAGLDLHMKNKLLGLVLKWCRIVCAFYGMKIENFTVSFGDGRALCYLLHHYHPALLPLSEIRTRTMMTYQEDLESCNYRDTNDSFSDSPAPFPVPEDPDLYEQLLANEKENFRVLYEKISELGGVPLMLRSSDMSNTIPDEKVVVTYITYLCARLLDIRHESRAARVIQLAWRRYHLKKSHEHLKRKETAVIVIQRAVRRFLHKRTADLLKKKEAAAVIIQRAVRCFLWKVNLSKRKGKREFLIQEKTVRTLQAVYRGHRVRKTYLRTREAIITIQSNIKAYLTRKKFLQMKKAASVLQMNFRALASGQKVRREFLIQRDAALTIQAMYRGYCVRKNYKDMIRSVITIQSYVKAYLTRQNFLRVKKATSVLQRRYRALKAGQKCRKELLIQKGAVLTIQSMYRGHCARKWYSQTRKSAVTIQSYTRAYLARKKFLQMKKAVSVLQMRYRATLAGQKLHKKFLIQKGAAITIQAMYRSYCGKKHYKQTRRSIIIIQSHLRAYLERKRFLEMKNAASVLQMRYRALILGRNARRQFLVQKGAAITLQAAYRGFCVRRSYRQTVDSVVSIQSNIRAYLERKKFQELKKAACTLQTRYRALLSRRKAQKEFLIQKGAALTIQTVYRSHCARRKYRQARKSAVMIQSHIKVYLIRKKFLQMKKAATVLQIRYRALLSGRKARKEFLIQKGAAITIQAIYRGYCVRKDFNRTRESVITIQSYAKAHLVRKRFLQVKKATSVLQKRYRALVLGQKARREFLIKKGAALTIQAKYRGYCVRKNYRKTRESIVVIQSYVRAYLTQKRFQQMKRAALVLQMRYRALVSGRKTRREYLIQKGAALTIQAAYRGYSGRKMYRKVRNSAITIQSNIRAYLTRKKFLRVKKAATTLQTRYRSLMLGRKVQREFLIQRGAALTIQAAYRGYSGRKMYRKVRNSAITIQSNIRAYLTRKKFLRVKKAATTLQMRYRSLMLGRKVQREFLIQRGAALTIQAVYRGYCARKQYTQTRNSVVTIQSYIRRYLVQKKFQQMKKAISVLQLRYRALVLGRKVQREYLIQRGAALTIQAVYRGHCARKQYMQAKNSVVTIQSSIRRYLVQKKFQQMKKAISVLQLRYRALVLAQKVRREFLIQKGAALTIQAVYRGHCARKQYTQARNSVVTIQSSIRRYLVQKKFQQMKKAISVLQLRYRALVLAQKVRREFLIQKGAALTIQAVYRGHCARKQYTQARNSVVTIQSSIRRYLVQKKFQQKKKAISVLQMRYRALVLGRKVQREYLIQRGAALTIQAVYRGHCVRKNYTQIKKSVVTIQSYIRASLMRKKFLKLKRAASVLQMRYRALVVGQKAQREYLIQKGAALTIQAWYRGYCARKNYKRVCKSVVIIQSTVRAHLSKKSFLRMKKAASVLQSRYRALLSGRRAQREFLVQKDAALTIQAVYRGYHARKSFQKIRQSTIIIQSYIRSYMQQRNFLRMKTAASVLQMYYRASVQGQEARREFLIQKGAALKVQAMYRGYRVRKNYNRMRKSAVIIQASVKSYLRRRHFTQMKNAALTLQKRYRALVSGRISRREFLMKKQATLTIQTAFRGYFARKNYTIARKAVVVIQSHVKTYLAQKKFQKMKNAASVLQMRYRALVCCHKARSEFLIQKGAAITIQAVYRGYCAQKNFRRTRESVITIQSNCKTYLTRKSFLEKKKAVLVLQRRYRAIACGRKVRKEILTQKKAVVKIQAVYRSYHARKNYNKLRNSAIIIQSYIKAYFTHKRFLQMKNAACAIQMWYRALMLGRKTRNEFLACKRAALTIQTACRGYHARKNFREEFGGDLKHVIQVKAEMKRKQRMLYLEQVAKVMKVNLAAIRLQRFFRKLKTLRRAQEQLHSIITLQNWIRGRLQRIRYLRVRQSILLLQTRARLLLTRRAKAATLIQAAVRCWLRKKRQHKLEEAAMKVQAIWRGRQVRLGTRSRKLEALRQRIQEANRSATEDKKLGNRAASALDFLLKYKQLSQILEALMHLDVATRLSPACCLRLVEVNAVDVIYTLLRSCNRSQPHMEIIKYAVSILLNLAKYEKTVDAVYIDGAVDTVIELMQIYREKGAIFYQTCTLLGILGMDQSRRMEIVNNKKITEKIRSIHLLTARKNKITETRLIRQAKIDATKSFNSTLPIAASHKKQHKIRPDWVLHRDKMHEIQNPMQAINFVLDCLCLKPK